MKPKTFNDFVEDVDTGQITNIDDILGDYKKISKVAKDLIPLSGKSLHDALTSQSNEFYFFRRCMGNLKIMLDYYEALLRNIRGKLYRKIRADERREINDRGINSLIDSNDQVLILTQEMLKVKEMHDTYWGIVEAYLQRGYSLNNITKSLEIAAQDTPL